MKVLFSISLFLLVAATAFSQTDNDREKEYCNRLSYSFDPDFAPFYHGVASGDALHDRVIIWTRVTPVATVENIEVEWFMATDTLFTNMIAYGTYTTDEDVDYTVKIDVTGLQADTWYYYYFRAFDLNSVIGRTKTVPVSGNDSLRIAVVSGSNYNNGFFNVYRSLTVRNDVDAVFHLGDYIYEYATNEYGTHSERALQPNNEIITLSDYRMRYSHYRLDPDLRYAHQQYPWYVIYDDHETANNSYVGGAENHSAGEGDWTTRMNAGIQAFFEWIPMRRINDPDDPKNKIRHTIQFGDLAAAMLLDTRYEERDDPNGLAVDDPNKRLIGDMQFNWLKMELYNFQFTTPVQWKLITQQVMFAPLIIAGIVANKDQWDGYQYERQRILDWIYGMGIKNTVVLTGDIHTSWANDVPNPSMGSYGSNGQGSGTVEFVTPSVTSPSTNSFLGGLGSGAIQLINTHMKWVELVSRGYYILDVNHNRCQADWYFINNIESTNYFESNASSWYVNNNENFLRQSPVPSVRLSQNPYFAPEYPIQSVGIEPVDGVEELVILGVYPNPFNNHITIQYFSAHDHECKLEITDMNGKKIIEAVLNPGCADVSYFDIDLSDLPKGSYLASITRKSGIVKTKRIIKL